MWTGGGQGWIEVLRLFRRMQLLAIKPDVVSYNILIDTAGKAQQLECAMQFFKEMRASGITPTVNTCALCQLSALSCHLCLAQACPTTCCAPLHSHFF